MKKLFVFVILSVMALSVSFAQTQRYQKGYTRKNGTYVSGRYKTVSDKTNKNNYSTKGNNNPYTSTKGTRAQDYSVDAYNYGSGKIIHTGSRGGQYYINSNGKRTYVPKRK